MSHALELAADADRALHSLPFELPEAVFDALDRIAREAQAPSFDDAASELVVIRGERELAYVEIHYAVDHGRSMVRLERLIAIIDDVL